MEDGFFDPSDTAPRRAWLALRADIAPAARGVITLAQRLIRCADRDLAAFGLSSAASVEALERFLLGHRGARLRLLVDAPDWLDTRAARLRRLQRRMSHAVEIRVASSDDPVGDDSQLFGDERHLLSLQPTAHGPGDVWLHNAPHAQPWVAGFDRRWDAAAHNLPVSPLGL
jgi:hypothetical protein